MNGLSWFWPTIILGSAIGAGIAVFANLILPIRLILSLWFFLVCPGMAYIRLLNIRDTMTEWTLAVALSLCIDTFVALIMLYSKMWSPTGGFLILIIISLVGTAIPIRRTRRSQ